MNKEQKIKLMVITPTLECGGSERYVSLLCNHLSVDRFEVTLVVLNNAHPFYEVSSGVKLVGLSIGHVRNALFPVKRIIRQEQPDIVYSTASHLNLLLATFRWMFPKKMKLVARESSILSFNSRRSKLPELYILLTRKFYLRIDLVICQSEYMRQDLVTQFSFPENKTVVIPNPVGGINIPGLSSPPDECSGKDFKFITVSRLSEEKGIDRLLLAVARLTIPFHYYIIGEGDQRKKLEALIDSLHLQGKVILTGEKINPYHHTEDADLFLMGSYYEGFPNVLLEAGLLGIPVVAFDVPGGIGEIIREGENGLLVKDGDVQAFAASIENAVMTGFNRQKIRENTNKRYNVKAIIAETEELFIELLSTNELSCRRTDPWVEMFGLMIY